MTLALLSANGGVEVEQQTDLTSSPPKRSAGRPAFPYEGKGRQAQDTAMTRTHQTT
jgi:hypothetical protein